MIKKCKSITTLKSLILISNAYSYTRLADYILILVFRRNRKQAKFVSSVIPK